MTRPCSPPTEICRPELPARAARPLISRCSSPADAHGQPFPFDTSWLLPRKPRGPLRTKRSMHPVRDISVVERGAYVRHFDWLVLWEDDESQTGGSTDSSDKKVSVRVAFFKGFG